jgi:hypothetical protein
MEDIPKKSLVEIVIPIVYQRLAQEIEKAKEQKKVDDFLESFEKWEKSLGGYGGARVPLKGLGLPGAGQFRAHKLGREETKAKKRREKEEKDLMKARSHKYLKREGVSGGYQYTYAGLHTNASANRDKAVEMFKVGMLTQDIARAFPEVFKVTKEDGQDRLGQKYDYELADGRKETKRLITADAVKKVISRFVSDPQGFRKPTGVKEFPSKYFSSDDPHDYEKFQTTSFGSGPDVEGFRVEGLHNGRWHSIREFAAESQAEKFQDELEAAKAEAPEGVAEEPGIYEGGSRLQPTGYEDKPVKPLKGEGLTEDQVKRSQWAAGQGKTMANTTHEERMEVAKTILDQMGGASKIKAMTGAKNFTALPSGVSFQFPSRKGPNYVKITLTPMDTYTVEFGRKAGAAALMSGKVDVENIYKKLSEHTDIYFDQLTDLFEKETGLYLSLGVREEAGEYKPKPFEVVSKHGGTRLIKTAKGSYRMQNHHHGKWDTFVEGTPADVVKYWNKWAPETKRVDLTGYFV